MRHTITLVRLEAAVLRVAGELHFVAGDDHLLSVLRSNTTDLRRVGVTPHWVNSWPSVKASSTLSASMRIVPSVSWVWIADMAPVVGSTQLGVVPHQLVPHNALNRPQLRSELLNHVVAFSAGQPRKR